MVLISSYQSLKIKLKWKISLHAAVIEELQISSGRYFCTFKNFPQFSKRLGFIPSGYNVIDHLLESN